MRSRPLVPDTLPRSPRPRLRPGPALDRAVLPLLVVFCCLLTLFPAIVIPPLSSFSSCGNLLHIGREIGAFRGESSFLPSSGNLLFGRFTKRAHGAFPLHLCGGLLNPISLLGRHYGPPGGGGVGAVVVFRGISVAAKTAPATRGGMPCFTANMKRLRNAGSDASLSVM